MRPRTKKHFTERMEKVDALLVHDPYALKGHWREAFGADSDSELRLEIGCGKGAFIFGMAKKYPDIMFVAMEVVPNVLLLALERVFADSEIKNVRFISGDARLIDDYFDENELDGIYLNFSDPWPRKKQHKNRLTHPDFLNLYKKVLKNGSCIKQKTDNKDLYDFSLESYSACGIEFEELTEAPEDNVMTEYETRFTEQGMPIYRVIATV